MATKRKRRASGAEQSQSATRALPKNTRSPIDPGKEREVTAMAGDSAERNQEGAIGPEPSSPSDGAHRPDEAMLAAPANPKLSSPTSGPPRRKRPKIVKLNPVAFLGNTLPGSNPTGPWSQRGEGKNKIAITRRLELGAYLRRCMELINVDGYRKIYLSAMGPAISHALLLCTSLPAALAPTFAPSDIKTTIITGTVQCIDEVIPDEEDEDEDEGGMQVRQKSCLNIDIIIGDGERVEGATVRKGPKAGRKKGQTASAKKGEGGKNINV